MVLLKLMAVHLFNMILILIMPLLLEVEAELLNQKVMLLEAEVATMEVD